MIELLSSPLSALVRASICLAIAAILTEIVTRASRLRSASIARALWFLVLAHGLVLATISLPVAPPPREQAADPPVRSPPLPTPSSRPSISREPAPDEPPPEMSIMPDEQLAAVPTRSKVTPALPDSPFRWNTVVFFIWGGGIALLALAGAVRYVVFAGRVSRARPGRPEWQAEWRELLVANGIRKDVPLAVDDRIGPLLCRLPGGYRLVVPEVLWSELSRDERKAVLTHELTHLRRGDLWLSFIASLIALPHWFNPFAWWAYFRFERSAEWACDDAAAESAGNNVYAQALIRLGSSGRSTVALTTSARAGRLFGRIRRVITEQPREDRAMKKGLLIGFACCLLLFAGIRLDQRPILAQPADDEKSASDEKLPERALVQLGSNRLRHRSYVGQVAYSPDGQLIAARCVNNDVGVHLWNAQDGRHVRHLNSENRRGWVEDFNFSPDGKWLVAAWLYKGLTLWDVSTGKLQWELKGDEAKAKSVAFAPDNKFIAVGGPDGSVVLRQAKDGALIRQVASPVERIFRNGGFVGRPPAGPDGDTVLAFSPDGSRLTRGVKNPASINVVEVATGKIVSDIPQAHGDPDGNVRGGWPTLQWLTMMPDGKRIISTGYRSVPREHLTREYGVKNVKLAEIRVWDTETGRQLQDLSGENVGSGLGYAALAPDGRTLAIATRSLLRLWNLEREELIRDIDVPGRWQQRPAFSPDGTRIIAGVGHSVAIWDVATGERLLNREGTHDEPVSTVAYSPDGHTVATGTGGSVRVWDAKSGRQRFSRRLGHEAYVHDLAFTPDGRLLIAAGDRSDVESPGGIVHLWNVETGDLVREIRTGDADRWRGSALEIAVSGDGKRLAIAEARSNNRKIQLWDITTGRHLAMYPPGDEFVWQTSDLRFSPDGRYIWCVCGNSHVYRWDTEGNEHFSFVADWRPPAERDPKKWPQVSDARFTSDASTLVTVADNQIFHFWDTTTGKLRFTMELTKLEKGTRFALSPDDSTIAVSNKYHLDEPGEDEITIWDILSRKQLLTLQPNEAKARSSAFSSDGKRLLTGLDRGTSLIWKLDSNGQ